MSKKKQQVYSKSRSDRLLFGWFLVAMGPSKNAYWRCLKENLPAENGIAKNGPKLIPKWFKIAQIA